MYFVYVLKSASGRFYIGSTQSIDKRLKKHNAGDVRSTKNYRPWKLVYRELYEVKSDALKRERELKSWKKRARLERLIERAPLV